MPTVKARWTSHIPIIFFKWFIYVQILKLIWIFEYIFIEFKEKNIMIYFESLFKIELSKVFTIKWKLNQILWNFIFLYKSIWENSPEDLMDLQWLFSLLCNPEKHVHFQGVWVHSRHKSIIHQNSRIPYK